MDKNHPLMKDNTKLELAEFLISARVELAELKEKVRAANRNVDAMHKERERLKAEQKVYTKKLEAVKASLYTFIAMKYGESIMTEYERTHGLDEWIENKSTESISTDQPKAPDEMRFFVNHLLGLITC